MSIFENVKIGDITKNVIESGITTCEHNHPGGSLFDAVDEVKNYLNAAYNAGYTKFAVTDHASFSAMQTCIDLAKKMSTPEHPFSIIYGVEAYIEVPPFNVNEKVGHMILLAVTEKGKHIIDKLNSKASEKRFGKPVITISDLKKYKYNGDVIATSACVSGAPAIQLLSDDMLDDIIKKERKAQEATTTDKYDNIVPVCIKDTDKDYILAKKALYEAEKKLNKTIAIRDSKELKAERTSISRQLRDLRKKNESYPTKPKDENDPTIPELVKRYEEINNMILEAKEAVPELRKKVTLERNNLNELQEKVDKYNLYESKIDHYKSLKKSAYELIAEAEKTMLFYQDIFGAGNYYIEVQNHGLDMEKRTYPILADLARKHNIPLVAANDAHMADNTERSIDMRNVAKFLRFTKVEESDADKELYIKTPYELAQALSAILPDDQVAEALNNLNVIGERCTYTPEKSNHYPVFDKNKDSNELLRTETIKGIEWRYPNGNGWDEEHQKRMEYELNIIIQMGFADYHLIVKDFLEYGRICGLVPIDKLPEVPLTIEGAKEYVKEHNYDVGIGIGIGRGSGAGSLVTYLLGITGIDPFKYNLIFERFLNPERVSMPDIDSDLAIGVREKTIEYVRAKYGNDAVVGIITESRQQAKGAIRDAARYYGKKFYDDDKKFLNLGTQMRKKIPDKATNFKDVVGMEETNQTDELGIPIEKEINLLSYMKTEYKDNKEALDILNIAGHCEGMLTTYGQHAAGVIIYDSDDVTDYIPVRDGQKGIKTTEMDMIQCEANGLLKMDFLGLRNLSIITDTLRMIKRDTGKTIDMMNVPLDGPEADPVYKEVYAKGRTKNVFQFESVGMRNNLKKLFAN